MVNLMLIYDDKYYYFVYHNKFYFLYQIYQQHTMHKQTNVLIEKSIKSLIIIKWIHILNIDQFV
ncbi:unnamed protein product [Schistosoma mattheei]|uniref:Uncharacterized protein n=1 Tax=Schistosoma mattheei TaxID=31246 RepID=A0A183PAU2_9TREM|nr:unnamed protein product [Schistosoma mattheei]